MEDMNVWHHILKIKLTKLVKLNIQKKIHFCFFLV